MQAVMAGQGLGSVLVSVVSLISVATSPAQDDDASGVCEVFKVNYRYVIRRSSHGVLLGGVITHLSRVYVLIFVLYTRVCKIFAQCTRVFLLRDRRHFFVHRCVFCMRAPSVRGLLHVSRSATRKYRAGGTSCPSA